MPKFRSSSRLVAAVTVMLLVAAACGSSSKSSGSAGTTSPTKTPTGSPIVIGSLLSQSGAVASSAAGGADTVKAWEQWVNASGGINGHPVQIEIADDASNAATGSAAVHTLVEEKKVIAFVGNFATNTEPAVADYLLSKHVPYISGSPFAVKVYTTNPVFFATTISGAYTGKAKPQIAASAGAKSFGSFVCAESAACDAGPIFEPAAKALGLHYAGVQKLSASAANYTAECLSFKQKGVDFVWMGMAAQVTVRAIRDCVQQGYKPTFGVGTASVSTDLLSIPGITTIGDTGNFPAFTDAAVLKDYRTATDKYAHGDATRTPQSAAAWSALEVFRKAMLTVKSATPTSQDVLTAMAGLNGEDLGGLLANKIHGYNAGTGPQPVFPCFFETGIKDGKFYAPKGLTPVCLDSKVL